MISAHSRSGISQLQLHCDNLLDENEITYDPNLARHRFSLDLPDRRRHPCRLVSGPIRPTCQLTITGLTSVARPGSSKIRIANGP